MTDTVNSTVIFSGKRRYTIQLQNVSDGTGESAVQKIDISTLTGTQGTAPTRLALEEIRWNIQGFTSVQLLFDATTDDEMATLSGNGYANYRDVGYVQDPLSTGTTGDIMLTTNGAAANATYDITASFILKD